MLSISRSEAQRSGLLPERRKDGRRLTPTSTMGPGWPIQNQRRCCLG